MDFSDFRQAREYAAWLLLAAAVIIVGMGAWFLLGLPGSGVGPLAEHGFASEPDFTGVTVTLLMPGPTDTEATRTVAQTVIIDPPFRGAGPAVARRRSRLPRRR